jgi:hypothetical protein
VAEWLPILDHLTIVSARTCLFQSSYEICGDDLDQFHHVYLTLGPFYRQKLKVDENGLLMATK